MNAKIQSRSGSVRLGCFFLVIIGGLLWFGGQHLFTAISNRKPTAIDYADYVKSRPSAKWLVITNCQLDLTRASYLYRNVDNKNPEEYYIPLQEPGGPDRSVHLLVQTRDPQLKATIREMNNLNSEDEARTWIRNNIQRVFVNKDVKGMVRFGIDLEESDRTALAKVHKNIAADFIIIHEGAEPSLLTGLGATAAALVLLVGGIKIYMRNREEA